ncbi:MAG: DNA/RNA-binding protein AlbA [Candidatus Woesearchaeota archaeon]|nr:MAG: DNA/RNA-binding protein AlbA [Candidatus Woesearchaeota archaeon]
MEEQDNLIFVGNKPFMNYVTGIVMQFTTKEASEVIVKARGKFITKAVDIVEVAVHRFLEGKIKKLKIETSSEDFKNKEEKDVRVSTITITLVKV